MESIQPSVSPLYCGNGRRCAKCDEVRPETDYSKARKVFPDWCKPCWNSYQRKNYKKNIHGIRRMRQHHLKRTYGITPEEYARMHTEQNGVCAICGNPEIEMRKTGTKFNLAVDHDHRTSAVRGLLCGHCNRMLGRCQENADWMRAAIKYLHTHSNL